MGVKSLAVYTNIMSTISLILCLLLLQAFVASSKADSAPVLEVQPAKINLGLTTSLEVNCSFVTNSASGLAALISLLVSRSNDSGQTFSEVASITEFTPTIVKLVAIENIQADGLVNQASESYIHLRWEYPVAQQGGRYQCSAQAMDDIGHIVVMTETVDIFVDEPNANDFLEKIRQMENYTKTLEKTLSQVEIERDSLKAERDRLVSEKDNCTSSLQTMTELYTVTSCFADGAESPHLTYSDRWYFLSKDAYHDVDSSQQFCQACGGYLTEIDDADEHAAIQSYLNSLRSIGLTAAVIGGNDLAKEGTWVLPSTNQALPYVDWLPGDPDGATSQNCLWLYEPNWFMIDGSCNYGSTDSRLRFLCEMPHH